MKFANEVLTLPSSLRAEMMSKMEGKVYDVTPLWTWHCWWADNARPCWNSMLWSNITKDHSPPGNSEPNEPIFCPPWKQGIRNFRPPRVSNRGPKYERKHVKQLWLSGLGKLSRMILLPRLINLISSAAPTNESFIQIGTCEKDDSSFKIPH